MYSFNVQASDGGIYDQRSEKVRVDVRIDDVNDNAPIFQEVPYRKSVPQGTDPDVTILTVQADDKDAGQNKVVTYKLQDESTSLNYFKINSSSGEIQTRVRLGTDANGYHNLRVIASDGGDEPLSTTGEGPFAFSNVFCIACVICIVAHSICFGENVRSVMME